MGIHDLCRFGAGETSANNADRAQQAYDIAAKKAADEEAARRQRNQAAGANGGTAGRC